jgi:hypothetical protein
VRHFAGRFVTALACGTIDRLLASNKTGLLQPLFTNAQGFASFKHLKTYCLLFRVITMCRSRRIVSAGLLLCCGILLFPDSTRGQAPVTKKSANIRKEGYVSGDARGRVNAMRDGKIQFNNPNTIEGYRRDLKQMAEFLAFRVTHDEYYKPTMETRTGELRPPAADSTIQYVLEDLDRYVLKPAPGIKFVTEQADYIKEFGVAIDAAIRQVLPPFAPEYATRRDLAVMRVNAARMLAIAAKSGAPAHAPTILQVLKDEKTPPEVLFYGIQAAENLLSAYDILKFGDRFQAQHTIGDDQLYELAKVLQTIVEWDRAPWMKATAEAAANPPESAPNPSPSTTPQAAADANKAEEQKSPQAPQRPAAQDVAPPSAPPGQLENIPEEPLTSEQVRVLRFYRRAAIRALAQFRFPIIQHPKDANAVAYPMWPLAKIAVNDSSVRPPTTPDEVAEAVIGLCNYQQFRGVDVDVLLDVIAAGLINFAGLKSGPDDKTIHWRIYAVRMITAFDRFRKTAQMDAALSRHAAKINSLANTATESILTRLERGGPGQAPDPTAIARWRVENRNPNQSLQPFTEVRNLVLTPAPRS